MNPRKIGSAFVGFWIASACWMLGERSAAAIPPPIHSSSFITEKARHPETVGLYAGTMEQVNDFAYELDSQGNIHPKAPFVVTELAEVKANSQGRETLVTVVDDINDGDGKPSQVFNGQLIADIVNDPVRRRKHIADLVAIAAQADGIELDYEHLLGSARSNYTVFIRELRQAMPPGKKISLILMPKTDNQIGDLGRAVDWRGVEPYVDEMKVMAYYYSYKTSAPGAILTIDQLKKLAEYTQFDPLQGIPREKLHIIYSLYGWDWPIANGTPFPPYLQAYLIDYDSALSAATQFNAPITRDLATGVLKYSYHYEKWDHQVWFNDAQTVRSWLDAAQSFGVPRNDIWHLGTGDTALWQYLAAGNMKRAAPSAFNSVTPTYARAGDPGATLTVAGTNFTPGDFLEWNGKIVRTTTYNSETQLTVQIPASFLTAPTTAQILIHTVMGRTNALTFRVLPPLVAPKVASLVPSSAYAGTGAFSLTVVGQDLDELGMIRWNGQDRPTHFIDSTRMTADVPATDIAAPGSASVTVVQGKFTSKPLTFTIIPVPKPTLTSLSPSSAFSGTPAFTLTVNGTNFISSATVQWNGAPRPTRLLSNRQLVADITAADIATAGTVLVTVAQFGQTSNALPFTIKSFTPPELVQLTPNFAKPGGRAFTLTVDGVHFSTGAVVRWNGQDRTTHFVNGGELTVAIPATDIAVAGVAQVTAYQNGQVSNALPFTISSSTPPASIASLNPKSATAGGAAFTLTVTGNNFLTGDVVDWNGSARTTTFVSATQLRARINAADIAAAGTGLVTVVRSTVTSNALPFAITSSTGSTPEISSLSPATTKSGGPAFTLTVHGQFFAPGATVLWNGTARPSTFVNTTLMTARIAAADIARGGTFPVAVSLSSRTSNALDFTVTQASGTGGSSNPAAAPTLAALNPPSVIAGSPGFGLGIQGDHFTPDSVVLWEQVVRPVHFVDQQHLTLDISATDLSTARSIAVAVRNSTGTSSALAFLVQENPNHAPATLDDARVYPNPWISERHTGAPVTFDRLTPGSTIKIYTTSARWVETLEEASGAATWRLINHEGQNVASGYYLYVITDPAGHRNRGKLAVVR